MPNFGDFQLEIYLQGLAGVRPALPMTFAELEARAPRRPRPEILSYVAGGAGDEHTQDAQRRGVRPLRLDPADAGGRRRARPVGRAARACRCLAADARAGRRHRAVRAGRPRRPRDRAGRRAHRRPDDRLDAVGRPAGGRRRRARRHARLLPALHAGRPRAGRELRPPRRGGGLQAASSSRSTRRSSAGARATSRWRRSRSCRASAWPTTSPIRSSAPSWRRRPRRTRAPPRWRGRWGSATRA